jgi:hypothetical protein
MNKFLVSIALISICSGCISRGGRVVSGPLSYLTDSHYEKKVVPRTAASKNLPLEMRITSSGTAVAAIDFANLDGYKNMTGVEILFQSLANVGDTALEYQTVKTGIHYGQKWFGDDEDEDLPSKPYSSSVPDGDNITINNTGNGRVDTDLYTVGQNRPTSVTINNTGNGQVDVDVNKAPAE